MKFTMTKIAAAAALAFASTGAMAASQDLVAGSVFNMFAMKGFDQNPGNASMTGAINVDTTIAGSVDLAAGTWAVSSTMPFFGNIWTASNGTIFSGAGDYALNTATGAISAAAPDVVGTNDANMHFTLGAGQVAGVIDFAWSVNSGIKVVNVWNVTDCGGNTCLTTAAVPGMENGPFAGYNAQFNLVAAPVPEASTYGMMLAGLGLVGFAVRRRKLMA